MNCSTHAWKSSKPVVSRTPTFSFLVYLVLLNCPWVPGSCLHKDKLDAVICLGCIIKGETDHDEYIAQAVANGLTHLSLMSSIPVIFGVLTTKDHDQAKARAGGGSGHKGIEAAQTAIKMAHLAREMKERSQKIGF